MPSYTCSFCDARFQRSAHLSRHTLLHLGERPFKCPSCERTFTRRDTLQRHVAIHDRSHDKDRQESPGRRVKHACRKCSRSKQRCDGKKPCNRCVQKYLGCSYRVSQSPEATSKERQKSSPSSQLPQSSKDRNQTLDSENNCNIPQNYQTGYTQSIWPREYDDQTGDVVSASAAPVACSASVQPDFTAEANDFESMPLMTDYPGDISFSAFDVAYWDVSQNIDTLYQSLGTDFGFVMSVDGTESSQIETLVSEPDLDPNIESPPVPSFLDARASPEPLEGQGLKFDDYVRKVFANRRHLHKKNVHGQNSGSSRGRTLEKAHIPPLMGDFPPLLASGNNDSIWEPENLGHVPYLPRQVYEQIATTFQNVNITRSPYIRFAGGAFPSLAACNAFMQLYFEEFNPLFPILHQPTFEPSATPWLLVLATISIGIRFAREPAAVECGDMMQEFLRRAFLAMIEGDYSSSCEPWLAQAGLLNQIGMGFSKDMRLFQSAQSMRSLLSSICRQVNCFQEKKRPATVENNQQSTEDAWKIWLRRESMRRLAYTLWLVDSQYLLYFDLPPLIPMKLLRVRLPCDESLWHAPTASSWLEFYKQNGTYLPLSIREELNNLYHTHVRQQGLGDFAVLLLTVGVFRNAMEARRALDEGFYLLPYSAQCTAQPGPISHTMAETSTRKAMEYLRILCPVNEEVPNLSSLKSTIVHHYHAIGVLLRIPLGELFCYCGYRVTSADITHCEIRLKLWMQQRGEEARQVAFHAGQLFAYIRRSNLHYHYEGRMMLIACQALWIYAATAESTSLLNGEDQAEHSTGRTSAPSIRLDQALTREAVESWVRNGDRIRPCLAGVGSLHGAEGVSRLVQEGSRVMCASSTWAFNIAQGRCLRIYHQVRSGSSAKGVG